MAARGGRNLISFCCNDYLGLTQHPKVKAAAIEATQMFGAGAGASRLVTGNHLHYRTLETRLAEFKGTEAACVFGSGYLVNAGVIPCFVGKEDLIIADELSHACLFSGSSLSGATVMRYTHNDVGELKDLLDAHRHKHPHCLILTEGVFSMDGDMAPLPEISDLALAHDAWLMCDDAHGIGVIGEGGRGSAFAHGQPVNIPLQTGTLSKAIGAYGGYICGSRPVIDLIKNRARTLIYTTGLPPATIAAALTALDIIRNDARLRAAPLAKARMFCAALGLPEAESSIVPIIIGSAADALAASRRLEDQGYLVTAIRPPTVPDGMARLRITFSAMHRDEDVMGLVAAVRQLGVTDHDNDITRVQAISR